MSNASREAFVKIQSQINSENILLYMLSLLNSKIGNAFAKLINPTINTPTGDIQKIPVLFNKKIDKSIVNTSSKNVAMSKTDWDSFETSWDFTRHPILSKIDEHNRNWNGFLKQNHCNVPILSQIIFLEEYYG
ncbi:Protein of unknown function [Leuconostoc citreum LBAE C10]|nr:Protein of unknown function [Leuconostoc citreum LBAE C10]